MQTSNERFDSICQYLALTLPDDYGFKSELASIYDHLVQIMGDDSDVIAAWMHNTKSSLNGKAPADVLDNSTGLSRILKLLRRELEMDSLIG